MILTNDWRSMARTPVLLMVCVLLAVSCSTPGSGDDPARLPFSLAVQDLDDQEYDLGARHLDQGETIALFFFSPSSPTSEALAGDLRTSVEPFRDRVRILGITPGPSNAISADRIRKAASDWKLDVPLLRDSDLALVNNLYLAGIPALVVLTPDRHLAYRGYRPPSNWDTVLD